MNVTAVVSMRGGTGKTSLSLALGAFLTRQGVKTCVIDLDFGGSKMVELLPDCNTFSNSIVSPLYKTWEESFSAHSRWTGFRGFREVDFGKICTANGLYVLPASPEPYDRWENLREEGLCGEHDFSLWICHLCRRLKELGIEHVILDTPPGYRWFTYSAIIAADSIVCCAREEDEADYVFFRSYGEISKRRKVWPTILLLHKHAQDGLLTTVSRSLSITRYGLTAGTGAKCTIEVARMPTVKKPLSRLQPTDQNRLEVIANWVRATRDPRKPRRK